MRVMAMMMDEIGSGGVMVPTSRGPKMKRNGLSFYFYSLCCLVNKVP